MTYSLDGVSSLFLNFVVICPFALILCNFNRDVHSLSINIDFSDMLCFFDLACFQAATLKIVVGSHIWLEDKDLVWIDGEVFRTEGQNVHVHTTNGKTVCVSDVAC
jgi:hypothetical protein